MVDRSDGLSDRTREVLDQANAIQGENLAFEMDGEGVARPAFPVRLEDELPTPESLWECGGVNCGVCGGPPAEATYFVDETGEYGPRRPGL